MLIRHETISPEIPTHNIKNSAILRSRKKYYNVIYEENEPYSTATDFFCLNTSLRIRSW